MNSGLSVVLPVYNEAENISMVLEQCLAELPKITPEIEIIAVNDGSRDGTADVLARYVQRPGVRVVTHERNQGYGAALRSGFEAASKPFIFFTDSDRQFDIKEVDGLWNRRGEAEIIAGYRMNRNDPWVRKAAGWGFTFINRTLLGIRVRDLNCAFKLFRAEFLKSLKLESTGAFINAEILGWAARRNARVVEVGVHHYPRLVGTPTGLQPLVVLRAFWDLGRLAWRIRRS